MEHLKKYWYLYLAGLIILILAIRYFRKPKAATNGDNSNPPPDNTTPPSSTTNLKVTNSSGAEVYNKESDGSMKGTGQTVSKDTTLAYTNKTKASYCPKNSQQCFMPKDFYQTSSGWLLETDITII